MSSLIQDIRTKFRKGIDFHTLEKLVLNGLFEDDDNELNSTKSEIKLKFRNDIVKCSVGDNYLFVKLKRNHGSSGIYFLSELNKNYRGRYPQRQSFLL